jgi:hypothetical protein
MTGPSLAGLWGRKAGGLSSFDRYSDPLKSSEIIWDDRALDEWLTDPQRMVPDNGMPFEGIKDAGVSADLLAFLKEAAKPRGLRQSEPPGVMNLARIAGIALYVACEKLLPCGHQLSRAAGVALIASGATVLTRAA